MNFILSPTNMSPLSVHSLVEWRREEPEVRQDTREVPGPAAPHRLGYHGHQGPWSPGGPQPPPIGGWVVAAGFIVWGEGGDKPSVDPPILLAWDC